MKNARKKPKEFIIRDGFKYIKTYGFRCGRCGKPLPVEFGDSKQLIKFSNITCPGCLKKIKYVEYEPEASKDYLKNKRTKRFLK